MSRCFLLAGLPWLIVSGCGQGPSPYPMAFFIVVPEYVCEADDHTTPVLLDASLSSSEARLLIAGEARAEGTPLRYRWNLGNEDYRISEGDLEQSRLVVSFPGARTRSLELEVTNEAGAQAVRSQTLGLIRPSDETCEDTGSCGANEECLEYDGVKRCLPRQRCDAGLSCPACYRCDEESGLCVP